MVVTNVRDITELKALKEEVIKSNNESIKYKSLVDELKSK